MFGRTDALGDFRSVPPAQLLPEMIAELRALQSDSAVEAAQLSVLTAQTLTALGQGVQPGGGGWLLGLPPTGRPKRCGVRCSLRR